MLVDGILGSMGGGSLSFFIIGFLISGHLWAYMLAAVCIYPLWPKTLGISNIFSHRVLLHPVCMTNSHAAGSFESDGVVQGKKGESELQRTLYIYTTSVLERLVQTSRSTSTQTPSNKTKHKTRKTFTTRKPSGNNPLSKGVIPTWQFFTNF